MTSHASRPAFAPLVCALLLIGCNQEVTDTEERTFRIECEENDCILIHDVDDAQSRDDDANGGDGSGDTRQASDEAARQESISNTDFVVDENTRILRACPAAGGKAAACRALTCGSGSVCSRLGGPEFSCVSGLCQAADRDIQSADRIALCLAGTGPWERSRTQLERYTLARGCRPPCEVPAACRQP